MGTGADLPGGNQKDYDADRIATLVNYYYDYNVRSIPSYKEVKKDTLSEVAKRCGEIVDRISGLLSNFRVIRMCDTIGQS